MANLGDKGCNEEPAAKVFFCIRFNAIIKTKQVNFVIAPYAFTKLVKQQVTVINFIRLRA